MKRAKKSPHIMNILKTTAINQDRESLEFQVFVFDLAEEEELGAMAILHDKVLTLLY